MVKKHWDRKAAGRELTRRLGGSENPRSVSRKEGGRRLSHGPCQHLEFLLGNVLFDFKRKYNSGLRNDHGYVWHIHEKMYFMC